MKLQVREGLADPKIGVSSCVQTASEDVAAGLERNLVPDPHATGFAANLISSGLPRLSRYDAQPYADMIKNQMHA
jgi:hypothetical protein